MAFRSKINLVGIEGNIERKSKKLYMMKQQTAVEQAFDWIISNIEFRGESDKKRFMSNKKRFMKIEKEQIVNAVDGFPLTARGMGGEEYYSETYENPNT